MEELEAHWRKVCDYINVVCERCQFKSTRLNSLTHDCVETLLLKHVEDQKTIEELKHYLDRLKSKEIPAEKEKL